MEKLIERPTAWLPRTFSPIKHVLRYDTAARAEIRTLTQELNGLIAASRVESGTLLVYSLHTTLGLLIQETGEPNLCQDFIDFLTTLVPDDGRSYKHSCALHPSGTCLDDRFNAPSHVRQMLTNQSLILDIEEGRLNLGRWQDVAFLELDGPRQGRQLLVKILPE